jgi:hypothetical protein
MVVTSDQLPPAVDSFEGSTLRRQPASSGSLAAAAVGKRILKQQLKTQLSSTAVVTQSGTAFR